MKRLALSLSLAVAVTGIVLQAQEPKPATEEVKQEITDALENFKKVFEHDFDVAARSKEVNALIAKQLAKQSPMPISLSHVVLHHKDGKMTVEAKVAGGKNLPPEFRGPIEQGASGIIQQSPFGQLLQTFSHDALDDGLKFLAEKDAYTVLGATETMMDVRVDDIKEQMLDGKTLESVRLRLDRAHKLLRIAKLKFADGKYVAVKIDYKQVAVPGEKTKLFVQKLNTFKHDLFLMEGGKGGLPEKFTVEYGNYKFK